MANNPLFKGMEFSDNPEKLMEWIPLIMEDRPADEAIAATKIDTGTDVNFGALTRMLFDHLKTQDVDINYKHSVESIKRAKDGSWELKVHDIDGCRMEYHTAKFVFLGAGGGSLELLQKSGIPEGKHIGGFPISGLFMVCNNQEIVEQHHAKVYGKAAVGAPPMSVPHLDTRFIDNKKIVIIWSVRGLLTEVLKNRLEYGFICFCKTA